MKDSDLTKKQPSDSQEPKRPASNRISPAEQFFIVGGFSLLQKLLLVITGLLTLSAAANELFGVYQRGNVELADILLLFLYTEVVAMVLVSYTGRGSPFVYPIFIAITAIARLIVLQGKEMNPQNIVFEAGAIVLLTIAATVLMRLPRE
ncbi:phosphate-starvation-inducible PsiE family protein [Halomonas sp. CH40]